MSAMSSTVTEDKILLASDTSPSAGGDRGGRRQSVMPPVFCPPSSPGPRLGGAGGSAITTGRQAHAPAVPQPLGACRQDEEDLHREVESYFPPDQMRDGLGRPGVQLLGTEVINLCNDLAVLEQYVGVDIALTSKFINILSPTLQRGVRKFKDLAVQEGRHHEFTVFMGC